MSETHVSLELEALVDKYSLAQIVDALAEVAFAKAEHLQANWQDKSTAKVWERAGSRLRNAGANIEV
jgi:hypothetical protein